MDEGRGHCEQTDVWEAGQACECVDEPINGGCLGRGVVLPMPDSLSLILGIHMGVGEGES